MKVTYILIAIISLLVIARYSASYFSNNTDTPVPDAVRGEPDTSEVSGRCMSQFKEYKEEAFSICYPDELQPLASGSAHSPITFSSEDEELIVGYDPEKKWQIHLCNFEKKVTVASQSALRTTFNQESTAGCGRPYRFVTTLEFEKEQFSIDLRKRDGTYVDSSRYEMLEQSLMFENISDLP